MIHQNSRNVALVCSSLAQKQFCLHFFGM
jgi:hypothetical protein